MDATELDFEPNTFDIAVSNALGAYLDYDEARDYYEKIRDILKFNSNLILASLVN